MTKLNCNTIEDLYDEIKERYGDSEQVSKIALDTVDGLKLLSVEFIDDTCFLISKYDIHFFMVIFDCRGKKDDSGTVSAEEVLLNIEKEIEIL